MVPVVSTRRIIRCSRSRWFGTHQTTLVGQFAQGPSSSASLSPAVYRSPGVSGFAALW